MKHVHAELIKQLADGAEIQYCIGGNWYDCGTNPPCWSVGEKYRIKPDPRAARDMAIAQAVRAACIAARFTIPGDDGIDLAAIIASVKE